MKKVVYIKYSMFHSFVEAELENILTQKTVKTGKKMTTTSAMLYSLAELHCINKERNLK